MTDNSIQWSKLLDLFLKYAHFESDREREEMCMFKLSASVCLYKQWNCEFSSTSKTRLLLLLKNNTTLFY